MIQVEGSIEIEAPRRTVWKLISDPRRFPEWVASIHEMVDLPDGAFKEGAAFQERGEPGPFRGYTIWRVTEFKSPYLQVHKGVQGVMLFVVTRRLDDSADGTLFKQTVGMRFHTVMKPVEWALAGGMRRKARLQLDRTLADAKALIEREKAGAG